MSVKCSINQVCDYLCSVKNRIKIVCVFVLTAIYCAAIGIVSESSASSHNEHGTSASLEKVTPVLSSKFVGEISTPFVTPTLHFNSNAPVNIKCPSLSFASIVHSVEHQLESAFSQYDLFSINFPVKRRKTDIIFPFHYFW